MFSFLLSLSLSLFIGYIRFRAQLLLCHPLILSSAHSLSNSETETIAFAEEEQEEEEEIVANFCLTDLSSAPRFAPPKSIESVK